jgi:hypothetical protein
MSDVIRDDAVQATIAGEMFVYSNVVTALAGGATNYSSFRTGPYPVLIERRSYGTTANSITIALYEGASSTGGTPVIGTNRDRTALGLSTPEPQTCRVGVTPGALPAALFTLRLDATNTVNAAFGDPNTDKIRLAANTDHVLGITNNDGAAKDVSWSFLVRRLPR